MITYGIHSNLNVDSRPDMYPPRVIKLIYRRYKTYEACRQAIKEITDILTSNPEHFIGFRAPGGRAAPDSQIAGISYPHDRLVVASSRTYDLQLTEAVDYKGETHCIKDVPTLYEEDKEITEITVVYWHRTSGVGPLILKWVDTFTMGCCAHKVYDYDED